MNQLDITDIKLKDNALKTEIARMVKETQMFLVRPYPDKIVMTKKQFEMLSGEMLSAYGTDGKPLDKSTERIYLTPYNAMETIVK